MFNKTIAGRRRTLLLNVKPAENVCENLFYNVVSNFSLSLIVLHPATDVDRTNLEPGLRAVD